jgi:hypothetical protein
MSLLDAIDAAFRNFAYRWAFSNPAAQALLQHHDLRPVRNGRARASVRRNKRTGWLDRRSRSSLTAEDNYRSR